MFESLQDSGFPGAPLFILFLGFFGRKRGEHVVEIMENSLISYCFGVRRVVGFPEFHFSYMHRLAKYNCFLGLRFSFFSPVFSLFFHLRAPHMTYYNELLWMLPDLTEFADVVISQL